MDLGVAPESKNHSDRAAFAKWGRKDVVSAPVHVAFPQSLHQQGRPTTCWPSTSGGGHGGEGLPACLGTVPSQLDQWTQPGVAITPQLQKLSGYWGTAADLSAPLPTAVG